MYSLVPSRSAIAVLAFAFALSSCCGADRGPDIRVTTVAGPVVTGADSLGSARINVFEGGVQARSMTAVFSNPAHGTSALRGHVTRARLLNSLNQELFRFAVSPLDATGFLPAASDTLSSVTLASLVSEARGGGIFLELLTTVPGLDSIRTPLPALEIQRVHRGQCEW